MARRDSLLDEVDEVLAAGNPGSTGSPTSPGTTPDYRALARQAAAEAGVDADLFERLITQESAWKPDAVSPKGAIGLGQLMPATARELGVDPRDPAQNLWGAARYLRAQMDRFRDPAFALAAYNAGPGAVQRYGGIPPYAETQDYVQRIMGSQRPAAQNGTAGQDPLLAEVDALLAQDPAQDTTDPLLAEVDALLDADRPGLKGPQRTGDIALPAPPEVPRKQVTPKLDRGYSPVLTVGGRRGRFNFDVPPEVGGTPRPRYAFDTETGDRWYMQLETDLQGGRWDDAHHAKDDFERYKKLPAAERTATMAAMWGDNPIASVIDKAAAEGVSFAELQRRLKPHNTHRQISDGEPSPQPGAPGGPATAAERALTKATGISAGRDQTAARLERAVRAPAAGLYRGMTVGLWGAIRSAAELTGLDSVAEYAGSVAKAAKDTSTRIAGSPAGTGIGTIERDIYGGLESVGQSAPALVAGVASGNPAVSLGMMGVQSGGDAYQEARTQNVPPGRAASYAVVQGLTEALTEKIPASRLIADLQKRTGLMNMVLGQLGAEIPGEQVATAVQDMNDWVNLHPERPFSDYLAARPAAIQQTLVSTMVATLAQTGGVALAQAGLDRLAERPAAGVAENANVITPSPTAPLAAAVSPVQPPPGAPVQPPVPPVAPPPAESPKPEVEPPASTPSSVSVATDTPVSIDTPAPATFDAPAAVRDLPGNSEVHTHPLGRALIALGDLRGVDGLISTHQFTADEQAAIRAAGVQETTGQVEGGEPFRGFSEPQLWSLRQAYQDRPKPAAPAQPEPVPTKADSGDTQPISQAVEPDSNMTPGGAPTFKPGDTVRIKGDADKLHTVDSVGDDGWVYLKSGGGVKPEQLDHSAPSEPAGGWPAGMFNPTPSHQENVERWQLEGQARTDAPAETPEEWRARVKRQNSPMYQAAMAAEAAKYPPDTRVMHNGRPATVIPGAEGVGSHWLRIKYDERLRHAPNWESVDAHEVSRLEEKPAESPTTEPVPPMGQGSTKNPGDVVTNQPPKVEGGAYGPAAKRAHINFKSSLSRLQANKKHDAVIALWEEFQRYYDSNNFPYPDDWHRWERAADDARLALQREGAGLEGITKPMSGKPDTPASTGVVEVKAGKNQGRKLIVTGQQDKMVVGTWEDTGKSGSAMIANTRPVMKAGVNHASPLETGKTGIKSSSDTETGATTGVSTEKPTIQTGTQDADLTPAQKLAAKVAARIAAEEAQAKAPAAKSDTPAEFAFFPKGAQVEYKDFDGKWYPTTVIADTTAEGVTSVWHPTLSMQPMWPPGAPSQRQTVIARHGDLRAVQTAAEKKPVTPQVPSEPGTKYVLPSFVTGQQTKRRPTERDLTGKVVSDGPPAPKPKAEVPNADLDARKAANAAKREELFKKLRGKVTSGVDPDDILAMSEILLTYVDDGITEFRRAWRQFKADAPDLADKMVRHFELAWEELRGEVVNVATIDDLAPTATPEARVSEDVPADQRAVRLFTVFQAALAEDKLPKDPRELRKFAQRFVGGDPTTYTDDITDAVEAAMSKAAPSLPLDIKPGDLMSMIHDANALEAKLPRANRSLEKLDLQQFSTPLPLAVAAQYASGVRPNETVMEPTAGTGHLISGLLPTRYNILARELSERRASLLKALGFHTTQGDYLAMTEKANADVIITNPPWGKYTTGKYGAPIGLGFTPIDVAERFVAKNIRDLKDGGRLVAVMPTTMLKSVPFLSYLQKHGAIRAIIQSPPGAYETRSTSVDSLLLVWDKGAESDGQTLRAYGTASAESGLRERAPNTWEEYADLVTRVATRTEAPRAEQPIAAPPAGRPAAGRPAATPRPAAGNVAGTGGSPRPGRPESRPAPDGTTPVVQPPGAPAVVAAGGTQRPGPAAGLARSDTRDPTRGLSADGRVAFEHASASQHFAPYRLRTDLVGQRHPKLAVEARALAGVPYPELTLELTPAVKALVTAGRVSIEQAEQAMAAVQANIVHHHGYLAADNVGVGKSREIGLTILDLMARAQADGRDLRLMVTTKNRDTIAGLIDFELRQALLDGKEPDFDIVKVSEFKNATQRKEQAGEYEPLPKHKHAIYVVDSYNVGTYRKALLDVGLHGVIGDEVHNYKNADAAVGAAWQTIHGQIMLTVPRAQQAFAYFTATPAQSVYDYRYLYGLREWPIDGFDQWVLMVTGHLDENAAKKLTEDTETGASNPEAVIKNATDAIVGGDADHEGGNQNRATFGGHGENIFNQLLTPAEAEQIPREWKMKGKFSSRDLWREGTEFSVVTREMPARHRKRYDAFAQLARDIVDQYDKWGKHDKSGRRMMFGPTGMLQNAAKRVQMQPAIEEAIEIAKEQVALGHQVVLSLINVNDMDPQEGNIAAAIEMINHREVSNDDGVITDHGDIPEALIARAELLEQAAALGSFDNPLDLITEAFGKDNVALIIGKGGTGRQKLVADFQAGTRKVAVISAAGTTGINLDHVTKTDTGAQGRRVFIDVQYEWSASTAVQRYGRVDRSSSITQPKIFALNFGSASEKKFLATVANRMSALGALSKGGSESTGAGALEEFEITGDDAIAGARAAWNALSDEDRRLWRGSAFWNRQNRDNPVPVTHTTADMRQIQLALLWLPIEKANAYWESFIEERQRVRDAMGYVSQRRAQRNVGEILREITLDPQHSIFQVRNDNGERFGILQGLVMGDMPRLASIIRFAATGRHYATFTAKDGQIVAGLVVPWTRIKAVARLYGRMLAADVLDTPEKVSEALNAGEKVELAHNDWALRKRQDGKIAIDGAKMADRELVMKHGGAYSPVGNFWHVTDLEKFLDRFPAKRPDVTIEATDEDPDAEDGADESRSESGGRRVSVLDRQIDGAIASSEARLEGLTPATNTEGSRVVPFPTIPNAIASRLFRAADIRAARPTTVDLEDLVATQETVSAAKVQEKFNDTTTGPPLALAYRGRYFLADGTHRATAAWARGQTSMTVLAAEVSVERLRAIERQERAEAFEDADDSRSASGGRLRPGPGRGQPVTPPRPGAPVVPLGPSTGGALQTTRKPIQPVPYPEMVELAMELAATPSVVKGFRRPETDGSHRAGAITLHARLFRRGNEQELANVLSHEIGHLTDWLPTKTMKRGNLLGRLFTLRNFLRHTFTTPSGTTVKLEIVTAELRGVSKRWRPWDETTASQSFRDYRNSSRELYADALSMLLNDPGLLQRMAPTFYQQFFEALDAKPEVKRAFFELQEVLNGTPESVIARRHGRVLAMFDGGDVKAVDLERIRRAQRRASLRDFWTRFRVEYIDKNVPFLDRARAVEKAGGRVPPATDPRYLLSERNYLGGKLKGFVERHIQPIFETLQDAGIGWHVFGAALFYERIMAGDRSELANPLGLAPKEAAEQHTHLMRSLSPEQRDTLNAQMDAFRAGMRDVTETAYDAGLYSDEMHEQMQKNPAYATYRVLDHLDEGVSAAVFAQKGTHKEIQNVADATILKALVTLQAAEHNLVKVGGFKFLHREFPDEIEQAKEVWNGKGHRPVEPKKGDPRKLVTYKEKGKLRGKYVDPFIADSLNDETASAGVVVKALGFLNSRWFRPVFTTFNVGFQTFNVRRDFGRTWKATPGMTIGRLVKRYAQAVPLARVRAFGPSTSPSPRQQQAAEDLLQAEESGILSVTYNDIIAGRDTADSQIEEILAKYQLGGYGRNTPSNPVVKAASAALGWIKQLGDFIETLPKGAAIYEFKGAGQVRDIPADRQAFIRERVGTPDILAGGTRRQESNNLILFSNAIVQALRADIQTAFVDPQTRSGFWWKTTAIDILPKLVMYAAMAGAAAGLDDDDDGWDDALARAYRNVTEYDRTNYTPIPLWTDAKGDTTYLRLPSDDTGRLIGGLAWKALSLARGDQEQDVATTAAQIFDYVVGQAPGPTPTLGIVGDSLDFLRGNNVYDSYRSRFLFTDDELRAGGVQALRKFIGYEFQEIGGGIAWRFYAGEQRPRDMTPGQKILELPVLSNILGRWVKVSSYGAVERSRTVQQRVAKGEAQRRLSERAAVNDALRDLSGTNPASPAVRGKAAVIVRDLYQTLPAAERNRKLADVHRKLRMGLVRGQADPLTDAVMSATSNAQKVATILDAKGDMTAREYEAWILRATQLGVISPAVRAQVRQARAQAQGAR